jgi:hypothetical protein
MTIGNQEIDAVATATRAQHGTQFEFFIVVNNAGTELLGDPFDS